MKSKKTVVIHDMGRAFNIRYTEVMEDGTKKHHGHVVTYGGWNLTREQALVEVRLKANSFKQGE